MNYSQNKNRICAVIPFYNEEKSISKIIFETLKYVNLIIAVNDGSTDHSLDKIKNDEKVVIINHTKNFGKGAALRSGFEKSLSLKTEITVTLDADLQHDPSFIPNFVNELENCDCVIGNRLKNIKAMPFQRKLSNYLTSKLLSLKTNYNILDSQSGYRAFKTSILKNILPVFDGFEAESEMIIKMAKYKYQMNFIEIPTIYGDEKSKMKAFSAISGFIKVFIRN